MTESIAPQGDKVAIQINGEYTAEELRGLLGRLASAHADVQPGGKYPATGEPVFILNGDIGFLVQRNRDGSRVQLAIRAPFLGLVGGTLSIEDAQKLAKRLTGQEGGAAVPAKH
jgi:hypothetical protein